MKRDEVLGQDPERKIVFAFLFSRSQKAISLFIKYSDERILQIAKQTIALHILFWHSGGIAPAISALLRHIQR